MLKLRKITTSIIAGMLVVVMSCSAAFAGQTKTILVDETNKVEVTEENKNDVKAIRKTSVTRKGRCEAIVQIQKHLNDAARYDNELKTVVVDGIYGPKTREALIIFWQDGTNDDLGYDAIAEDGIFGPKSREISKSFMLKPNEVRKPLHVGIVSAILNWYGYNHSFTYSYTNEFGNAVRRFQRDHGLAVDGIVGPDTYYAIFNK